MNKARIGALLVLAILLSASCGSDGPGIVELMVPPGYQPTMQLLVDGTMYSFGPFVGYYFKPEPGLKRARLVCFNERGFYASDMPTNALLFRGDAVLRRLPGSKADLPQGQGRIVPIFFKQAPDRWLQTRPSPVDEYLHFHSLHNAAGPAMLGYWLRHRAEEAFTYDMGGRVGPDSPLYHNVKPGLDKDFARIIEFDKGPAD